MWTLDEYNVPNLVGGEIICWIRLSKIFHVAYSRIRRERVNRPPKYKETQGGILSTKKRRTEQSLKLT